MAKNRNGNDDKAGSLGFEEKLWTAADVLRNNVDPAEYKHVVLGLIFLKYISDAFEERRADMRRKVKRLLRKHGSPPDKKETAVVVVIQQAERVCRGWARVA